MVVLIELGLRVSGNSLSSALHEAPYRPFLRIQQNLQRALVEDDAHWPTVRAYGLPGAQNTGRLLRPEVL